MVPALAPAHGPFATLVGVAGTVTSLAAMALALDTYDPARVHGSSLGRATLDAEIARLAGMTQAEREHIRGLDPRRADVILAGALLLRAILRRTGVDAVRVSDRGIRWGLYFERAAELDDALGAGGLPPAGVEDSFRS